MASLRFGINGLDPLGRSLLRCVFSGELAQGDTSLAVEVRDEAARADPIAMARLLSREGVRGGPRVSWNGAAFCGPALEVPLRKEEAEASDAPKWDCQLEGGTWRSERGAERETIPDGARLALEPLLGTLGQSFGLRWVCALLREGKREGEGQGERGALSDAKARERELLRALHAQFPDLAGKLSIRAGSEPSPIDHLVLSCTLAQATSSDTVLELLAGLGTSGGAGGGAFEAWSCGAGEEVIGNPKPVLDLAASVASGPLLSLTLRFDPLALRGAWVLDRLRSLITKAN